MSHPTPSHPLNPAAIRPGDPGLQNPYLEAMLQTALDGVWLVDGGGRFLEVNATACKMLGFQREELIGQPISLVEMVEDREAVQAHVDRIKVHGADRFITRHRRKDGRHFAAEISTTYLRDSDQFVVHARDLSAMEFQLTQARRWGQIFLHSKFGIAHADAHTHTILEANPAFAHQRGYEPSELVGQPIFICYPPEDHARIRAIVTELTARGFGSFEARHQRKDGSTFPVLVELSTLRDSEDQPTTRVVVCIDLSAQKQLERQAENHRDRLEALFRSSQDAIFTVDSDTHRILEVNPEFTRLTGYAQEEVVGRTALELNLWWNPVERVAYLSHLQATGSATRVPMQFRDRQGRHHWGEANSEPLEVEGGHYWVHTIRDISDRREAERRLTAEKERFQNLIESSPIPIYIHHEGRFTYANPAGVSLLGGSSATDLLGTRLLDRVHPEDREAVAARVRESLEQGIPPPRRQERLLTLGGETLEVEVNGFPMLIEGQTHVIVFANDLTERNRSEALHRKMEQEVARALRLESLGGLAGGVAHDMNNVLGAIMGVAEARALRAPNDGRLQEDMDVILKACLRGREMTRGLLGFARQELDEFGPLDLNELIREQVVLLSHTTLQKVAFHTDLEPGLPPIQGEAGALSHALMNLCVNGIQAMPEGGTLTLRTRLGEAGSVVLQVEDTGTGMTPEVAARAMDPFFTTKPTGSGTGLGLSMAYGVVKAHRGTIDLATEWGRGTCFSLTFPSLPHVPADLNPESSPQPAGLRRSLLVIDDDELIRETIAGLLELEGHECQLAASGSLGLARLQGGWQPDAVILDVNMPEVDGLQILERLRATHADLPVFLATGRAEQHVRDAATRHAHVSVLPKPFTLDELRAALATLP